MNRRHLWPASLTLSLLAFAAAIGMPIATAFAQPLTLEVASVKAERDQRSGQPIVSIWLTQASKGELAAFTQENLGHQIEIRTGGVVLMNPVIREPVNGGFFQVSGKFTENETKEIVDRVKINNRLEVEVVDDN